MSFIDLESQEHFTDSPEFDRATDTCSNTLLDVNNHLATLNKLIKLIEQRTTNSTATEKTCEKCVKNIDIVTLLFKQLSEQCKEVADLAEDNNPSHGFTKDRITRETKDTLQEFQSLQERFAHVNAELNAQTRAALDDSGDHAVEEETRSEMVLVQDEINNEEFVYQQELIREREEEIINIEHGIQELNDIFQDLGTIVQEQGTMVDNIETNIYSVGQSTEGAANELSRALKYQRNAGRTKCYLLTVVVVVLLVVILGIVI